MATDVTDPPALAEAAGRAAAWLGATFSAALIAATLVPDSAAAGQLRCASHNLASGEDARALRETVSKSLPPGVKVNTSQGICRNWRNARAFLETSPRPLATDVTEQWRIFCERETRNWSCEAPTYWRSLDMNTPIGAEERHVVFEVDSATSLDAARELGPRGLNLMIADDTSHPPACTAEPNEATVWARVQHWHRLAAAPEAIEVSISTAGDGSVSAVLSGDFEIRFRPAPGTPGTYEPCWYEWVIVD